MLDEVCTALFRLFAEVLVEIFIRLPGYALLRLAYRKDEIDPDGFGTFSVGCLFWLLVFVIAILVFWLLQGGG